ncbi:hypothetical protein POX_a01431 [Penicillium oxalicum]|uniref:Endosomal peripheral membrane protein n=1 Tax=Penicillium oxalicum (strain 114-2 / CGMCC 5302) TaxID=933388 RepID=S7ZT01_PENO1|nr:hypothetical protein POX_a01431 [Penicillium oxalicum]EPS33574.1 hypothetical protein PDE_08536 [Penicillium oxalicum 114-2]KAI2794830.1 hypothetical protein POX_a01431 [Penicillium oxalicum]
MSSQFLQAELTSLIQDSRRKHADLRAAAEQSLNELKALPSTSEAQISADLIRKSKFVDPFIIACHTRQTKLAGTGVICLQRLIASHSLPPHRLRDVLAGLKDTTTLGLDIQLKILQSLPSLLQFYSPELSGDLLANTLDICANLQASKTPAVSSTAAATFQQLVVSVFERVSNEDKLPKEGKSFVDVKVDGRSVEVASFAYDALKVLDDLCRLIDGEEVQFLSARTLSTTFILELIENIVLSSGRLFVGHLELSQVLRVRLMPLTVRYLSERHSFSETVRVARILLLLLKRHMSLLVAECEMAFGLLTHLLEPDGNAPWKRVLCMEVFKGLYTEPGVVRLIYSLYDADEKRKNVLGDHMASLVRLSSEKPSLIGVSNQSTIPLRADHARSMTEDQIALETGGVAGVIGSTGPSSDTQVPGISSQWSVIRTPYIDLLDKSDPPLPPETYIYSLVLNCISSFAEGLAKFILPLTVPDMRSKKKSRMMNPDQGPDSTRSSQDLQSPGAVRAQAALPMRKSSVPVNPLELHSHVQYSAIRTCSGIIESCWPAVLAACSTFLHASLDDEFYHNLVRAFQKLAHVAGLLRLSVPRDAFLTTLGKAAIPAGTGVAKSQSLTTSTLGIPQADERGSRYRKSSDISRSNPAAGDSATSLAAEASVPLSTRNLLCLRALLNLGIALGPTLDQPAWSILLETLQCAGLVIGMSSSTMIKSASGSSDNLVFGNDVPTANLGAEVIAVQSASAKLFESTSDYPSDSFREIVLALLSLSVFTEQKECLERATEELEPPHSPHASRQAGRMHQNSRRVSLIVGKFKMQDEELKFVLDKGNEIARANLDRLSSLVEAEMEAWQLLSGSLIAATTNNAIRPSLRLQASNILNSLIFLTMKSGVSVDDETRNKVQTRNLQTLKDQVTSLYTFDGTNSKSIPTTVLEIHEQSLDILHTILEQYAETLSDGWKLIFDLISDVFRLDVWAEGNTQLRTSSERRRSGLPGGPRLVRAAYKSLHLVASDFVSLLPAPCLLALVQSFTNFASQAQDFNISLTTTSFFWNVSDFLRERIERFSVETYVDASVSEDELEKLACNDDLSVSSNCLWLLLLLRIVRITTDSRSEIRNSAIHTLLRIFDAYGQQLSSKAWRLCLNRVLFSMIGKLTATLKESRNRECPEDEFKSWTETTVLVIKGVSSLIANFFDAITSDDDFHESWKRLFQYLQELVNMRLLELNEATFASVSSILAQGHSSGGLSKEACESVWTLWANGHPAGDEDPVDLNRSNQDAALAYMQSLQQLYSLHKDHLGPEKVETILEHLRLLVWNSVSPPYSPDVERSSAVQALVIECMKTLCTEKESSQAAILLCLADLSDSPLTKWNPSSDPRKPGFVAFSKALVDLISWYITGFGIKQDILSNDALALVLERFGALILQKYTWEGKDREPLMWQKASTAALSVLEVAVPYVENQYESAKRADIARFWRCVVNIAHGIVSAHGYQTQQLPYSRIVADENFDIASFMRLKTLILPSLGAPIVPDTVRQSFALALFHSSFIYAPQRLDMPLTSIEQDPLCDFYTIRPGRTFDPPPTLRPKMAYALIDTLFELAATSDLDAPSSGHRTLLACSAAPYLLLRCAISIKSFIADQPLRGLMPQPTPARKDLLHLLENLVQLQSEPSAIPDSTPIKTVSSREDSVSGRHHRKHLEWILPLVVKAVRVAGKERDDGKVLQALGAVLQELGQFE